MILLLLSGSIAEAAYGIPDWIEKSYTYLDEPLKDVLRWERKLAEFIEIRLALDNS